MDGILNNNNDFLDDNKEIKYFFESIKRNKKILFICTLGSILLSSIVAFTSKEVWKGEFQIVVNEKKENISGLLQNIEANPLVSLIDGDSGRNLNTEMKILESPLVLFDVFNYIKKQKELNGIDDFKDLTFKDWRRDFLNIKREPTSRVLTITYKDRDKNLIPKVLDKIAKDYQIYSTSERVRSIESGIEYSKEQIKLYEEKSQKSLEVAREFSIEQDLTLSKDFLFGGSNKQVDLKTKGLDLNPNNVRVEYGNKIRLLDKYLEEVKKINEDSDEVLYFAKNLGEYKSNLLNNLSSLDEEIRNRLLSYKVTDKDLIFLKQKKQQLIKNLHKDLIYFLEAKKKNSKLIFDAAQRPKGILIQYEKLVRKAFRDYATLNKLEDQFRILSLEKARNKLPWELITKPTLSTRPVSPKRKRIIALGFLGGLFLGSVSSLIKDKKRDLIYLSSFAEKLLSFELISECNINLERKKIEPLKNLFDASLSTKEGSLCVYIVEESNFKIKDYMEKYFDNKNLFFVNDFSKINNYENLILLVFLGKNSSKKLLEFDKKKSLIRCNILGMITLNLVKENT